MIFLWILAGVVLLIVLLRVSANHMVMAATPRSVLTSYFEARGTGASELEACRLVVIRRYRLNPAEVHHFEQHVFPTLEQEESGEQDTAPGWRARRLAWSIWMHDSSAEGPERLGELSERVSNNILKEYDALRARFQTF